MKIQSSKQNLVWGGLLILLGVLSLFNNYIELSPWVWVLALTVSGASTFTLYSMNRTEKWLLIPSYILLAVAALITLVTTNILQDEAIGIFVLAAVAFPFVAAYFQDRTLWGLLIPAYILTAVGLMVGLIGLGVLTDLLIPAYVLIAISIPFFVVYLNNKQHWWALIPGGITAVIGLSFLIAVTAIQVVIPVALIIAGVWMLLQQLRKSEA